MSDYESDPNKMIQKIKGLEREALRDVVPVFRSLHSLGFSVPGAGGFVAGLSSWAKVKTPYPSLLQEVTIHLQVRFETIPLQVEVEKRCNEYDLRDVESFVRSLLLMLTDQLREHIAQMEGCARRLLRMCEKVSEPMLDVNIREALFEAYENGGASLEEEG